MILMDSVGQEFRKGTMTLIFLCFIMSKVWGLSGKNETAKDNSIAEELKQMEAYLLM